MRLLNWSAAVLPEIWQNAGFGLYIHWPFCQSKCPYCDFNSHVSNAVDQSQWADAYCREIQRIGDELGPRTLNSIFFGGGTPSLMEPEMVARVIDKAAQTWNFSNKIEITLEANPTSVEARRFYGFRAAGVNRVSIGVQALSDVDLRALGRLHSVSEAMSAIELAQSIFPRMSFDLIYARQNQTLNEWEKELRRAISLQSSHLSLYQLTIEPETAFGARFRKGKLPGLPNEDLSADMYELTQSICRDSGFTAYEISNHAKEGEESTHNLIYWDAGDYVGIGPGAHGRLTINGKRFATETPLSPNDFLNLVRKTGSGESIREELSLKEQVNEYIMMGLRKDTGIELSRFPEQLQTNIFRSKINNLSEIGMVQKAANQLIITPAGRPVLNAILRDLFID